MTEVETRIRHHYRPRGSARRLFECRADEVVVSGPAGTGKSMACLEKLNLLMLMNPGAKGLIVRKVQATLGGTALDTWRNKVIPEALATKTIKYYGGSSEQPPQYIYKNGPDGTSGSRVYIGGMDKATKVMSSEYDIIYVQEATELTLTDWEALTTRLRNGKISFQQIIADCNPDAPTHWLNARCERGQTLMLHSRHEENPTLFKEDMTLTVFGKHYIAKLDALTGVRKQRLRYGKWVAAEGLVYENFDPAIHLIDPFEIPPEWPRFWSIDFGFTNPFVCQWWAMDPDGRLYLYREIYRTKRTVDLHALDILAQVRTIAPHVLKERRQPDPKVSSDWVWTEPKPQRIICDHDAEARAVLEREMGLNTSPAHKTVKDGLDVSMQRLALAGDGKPRLYLMRNCVVERDPELEDARLPCSTQEEIVGYVWAKDATGKVVKEDPVKKDDHGMDGMRYVVADFDLKGKTRYRSFYT